MVAVVTTLGSSARAHEGSRWLVGTTVDYGATFHSVTPAAHVPSFGLYGGVELENGLTLTANARLPFVMALAFGRFDLGSGWGYTARLPANGLIEPIASVHLEGGYTWAFSDIQEGYLRGPNAVEYSGGYGRLALEAGALFATPSRAEVGLSVVGAATLVFTREGVRRGFDIGFKFDFRL